MHGVVPGTREWINKNRHILYIPDAYLVQKIFNINLSSLVAISVMKGKMRKGMNEEARMLLSIALSEKSSWEEYENVLGESGMKGGSGPPKFLGKSIPGDRKSKIKQSERRMNFQCSRNSKGLGQSEPGQGQDWNRVKWTGRNSTGDSH